jgi:hypothetical protein
MGPVTGPLAEGVYRNLRANNPVLASLYGVAAVASFFDLLVYGGRAAIHLHHMMPN